MTETKPVLHLLCGKIAAGKSTLASELVRDGQAILLSEDSWLARLYPGEIPSIADYVVRAARLREVMGPHIVALLQAGLPVVLDFPANTRAARAWMRGLAEAAGVPAQLHFLDVADEVCLARLRARNAAGAHDFAASDAEFAAITRHFVPPVEDEGLAIIRHG